jgi:hypothetical protein
VVHVAPSRRLRRRQAEAGRVDATGCVRPYYTCFAVFLEKTALSEKMIEEDLSRVEESNQIHIQIGYWV